MHTLLSLKFTLILTALLAVGCGGGSSGGDGGRNDQKEPTGEGEGKGGDARPSVDCETQWKERVAKAPVGQVKAYDIVEATTGTGDPQLDRTIKSHSREELVSATDEAIVTATRWEYSQPVLEPMIGETRLTKETFLLTCSPADAGEPEADPEGLKAAGVEILEDRAETVQVKAGTFQTRYQKIHVKPDVAKNEVFGDHWTINGETVVVKEKSVVKSESPEGIKSERTTERELVEYLAGKS